MSIVLLSSDEMGQDPRRFYAIARAPGLLAGMSYPDRAGWQQPLYSMGYRHVVCLTDEKPGYDPSPLSLVFSARLDDLVEGRQPKQPRIDEGFIRDAVALIVPCLVKGEGVVVHCAGGTGRTGTVLACTLKAMGVEPSRVLDQMKAVNKVRQKSHGWPESPWQQAVFDRF